RLLAHHAAVVGVEGFEAFHERILRQATAVSLWWREVEETQGLTVLDHRVLERPIVDNPCCRITLQLAALKGRLQRAVTSETGNELVLDAEQIHRRGRTHRCRAQRGEATEGKLVDLFDKRVIGGDAAADIGADMDKEVGPAHSPDDAEILERDLKLFRVQNTRRTAPGNPAKRAAVRTCIHNVSDTACQGTTLD